MRPAVLVIAVALALLLIWLVADLSEQAVETDGASAVATVAWGREVPPYVIDAAATSTTVRPRARTAPTRRTVHALSVPASAGEAVAVIRDVFARFGAVVVEQAVRVSGCETGGTYNPAVVNSSGHTGLFQLSPRYHTARASRLGFTWAQMREARPNALVAADLYAESGWGPWTCRSAA